MLLSKMQQAVQSLESHVTEASCMVAAADERVSLLRETISKERHEIGQRRQESQATEAMSLGESEQTQV